MSHSKVDVLRFRLGGGSGLMRMLGRCRADELPVLFAVLAGNVPLRAWGRTPGIGARVRMPDAA